MPKERKERKKRKMFLVEFIDTGFPNDDTERVLDYKYVVARDDQSVLKRLPRGMALGFRVSELQRPIRLTELKRWAQHSMSNPPDHR